MTVPSDSAGNQTRAKNSAGVWQKYEYDAAGRLVKVMDDTDAVIESYTYGPSNQHLMTNNYPDSVSSKTYYVWASGQVIAEYSEVGATDTVPQWTKSYVYLTGRLLSTIEPYNGSQLVRHHHPDRLGTRLVTNSADTSVEEQINLPFGTALGAESSTNVGAATSRRFTSYDRSGTTRLDYAVNRHYDSGQGRFTQPDPIGMGAANLSDPQSLNMYAYCGNDPVNHVDPGGLFVGWLKSCF